ncbi:hypothetical protein [Methanobacterium ferruginis]|uniref:hypothetical protein n=1 Tax=Methanobacterium ferruginis TaxID=710191 RepID=UPI002573672D|nr:hypothetical protein [Methanobacterium ferruginis]BDZ68626.1 hypothetical protein GCM10025860_20740 [Methanobacterium ferruginis]
MSTAWASNGLAASPGSINVQIQGTQVFTTEISVSNVGDSPLNVVISKKRMMKGGSTVLYADDGIATWITVDPEEFVLAPNEEKKVKVTINIPSEINYSDAMGALIILGNTTDSTQNTSLSGTSLLTKQVPAIMIPVIVGLPGEIIESISLTKYNVPWTLLSLMPGKLSYAVKNNGTVQATMSNHVTIKGLFENQNLTSNGTVYPGDEYTLVNEWTPGFFDMGLYSVESNINYGREQQNQNLQTKSTIFVFPIWLIIVILILLVGWQIRKKDIKSPIRIKIEKK